ncbi:MAG: hypothetical protein OJF49_001026 [Ktedonobacterales bacterium]|nr:MAG: hypothetical protein OJF49_001026 [Ktedonobacterales bacterium]
MHIPFMSAASEWCKSICGTSHPVYQYRELRMLPSPSMGYR